MFKALLSLLVVSCLGTSPLAFSSDQNTTMLFDAIGERLSYMDDVAYYKASKSLPTEDLNREAVVLSRAMSQAEMAGLDPDSVERFFAAQIAAAKAIQYQYREALNSRAVVPPSLDLETQVRPRLLALGDEIIAGMVTMLRNREPLQDGEFEAFSNALNIEYLSPQDKHVLFEALKEVRLAQH